MILNQYGYEIELKPTKSHGNVDMLSHVQWSVESEVPVKNVIYSRQISLLPILNEDIRIETMEETTLSRVIDYLENDLWPNDIDESL